MSAQMTNNAHFETASSWKAARATVTFQPREPGYTAGLRRHSIRIHVRDHKLRELSINDRTLEAHYGGFVLSQARKGTDEARRLALDVRYGSAGQEGQKPVCTTELGYMAGLMPEFQRRNCKIIGLSVDPVDNHMRWAKDVEETQGHPVTYPLIGDPQLKIAKLYDMLPEGVGDTSEGRTPADNATVRSVLVIGPDKKVKAMLTYPMTSGRNFDEVLRLLDSCQLTAKHQVATPVNWKPGEDVIIAGSVSDEQAREKYPGGWKAPKPYLRVVPQPH